MVTATTPGRGAGGDWARAPDVSKRTAAAPAISLRIGIEYMGCASKRTRQRFAGEAPAPQGAQWMRGLENASRARRPRHKVPSGCGAWRILRGRERPRHKGAQWMRGLENSSRARAPAPQRFPVDAGLGECSRARPPAPQEVVSARAGTARAGAWFGRG